MYPEVNRIVFYGVPPNLVRAVDARGLAGYHTSVAPKVSRQMDTSMHEHNGRWCFARWISQMALALNTTMLSCELKGLRWRDVEFLGWTITEYSASAAARS